MSFFDEVWEVLNESCLETKFFKFEQLFFKFKNDEYEFDFDFIPKSLTTPSYAKICDVCEMKELKNHKNADKDAFFLHSIAHIEYSAIDIALDACYRFLNLPKEYYFDWLEVAGDEIRHFKMINEKLESTGHHYGDFTVHNGLFIAMQKTANSLIDRMAVIPRFMEANGLDANLFMMKKITNDKQKNYLLDLLKKIHDEEIDHVKKGDKWFKFACKEQGVDPKEWINIVLKHYPKAFHTKRELDVKHRLMAGFDQNEIDKIINLQEKQ
ncbi:ferritin [Campylobacter fetus subsp. testudinum]|uniref:ferritin-like domain-containing protein n=2 Tax=Campylobacter fetus TaxID=196 RepID=UPI00081879C5|nr:ferritin-like domain-containing protein [Campylobacter fetus]EAK0829815.1 ferritin-like domain-containing protein [Campylobacter fetus]OCR96999.1 ferritin [Campylobacter fetus subsp. testudinum]OCS02272.1 ferritin [Campylobacter fetus subsp. testudinum]OCS05743.1 ferritin [Campylobacter fetus subsp. testudinum]